MEDFFFNVQLSSKEEFGPVFYEQVLENLQVTVLMLFKSFQNYRMMKHFPNYFSKLINLKTKSTKKKMFHLL